MLLFHIQVLRVFLVGENWPNVVCNSGLLQYVQCVTEPPTVNNCVKEQEMKGAVGIE